MTAEEMFKELGYKKVDYEMSLEIPRRSWGYGLDKKIFKLIYKNEDDLIIFYNDKYIATVQYGSGDDDDRIHLFSFELRQAINKQIEELGWNNEIK